MQCLKAVAQPDSRNAFTRRFKKRKRPAAFAAGSEYFKKMKLLDRYIFVEWLKFFLVAIGVTLGILVLHDMYNNLGNLIEWGAGTGEILLFYGLLIPTLIPTVLPISLLLSVIYVLGTFHRNNEITAMRAAGMNIYRITRSLWLGGFVLAGVLLWLNADVIPYCKENSRTLYENLRYEDQLRTRDISDVGKIQQLCFNNRRDGRLWFMNSFSMATSKGHGVRVSVLNDMGRETRRIMAREGVYDDAENWWFFTDGQETTYDPVTHRPTRAVGFDKREFKDFNEKPKIMSLSMRRPKDLSLFETNEILSAIEDKGSPEARPYLVNLYGIWASPLACIIVIAIGIPFSVAGVRTNPMVGVSKTFGLFFLYFVVDSVLTTLGGRGVISPLTAVVIPNALMLLFAFSLYRKVV